MNAGIVAKVFCICPCCSEAERDARESVCMSSKWCRVWSGYINYPQAVTEATVTHMTSASADERIQTM